MTAECGSGSGNNGAMLLRGEGMMRVGRRVGNVMVVRRRELRRAIGIIRAMKEIYCRIE